jgi:hypothetical protein
MRNVTHGFCLLLLVLGSSRSLLGGGSGSLLDNGQRGFQSVKTEDKQGEKVDLEDKTDNGRNVLGLGGLFSDSGDGRGVGDLDGLGCSTGTSDITGDRCCEEGLEGRRWLEDDWTHRQ